MIDEDLYQQAADELNSDRRRPALWARACALASDDHDEARFLYTNLRVEELLAEAEAGKGINQSRPASSDSIQSSLDSTLALEPIDQTVVEEEPMGFLDDFKPDEFEESTDTPRAVSTPPGVDNSKNRDDLLDIESATSHLSDPDATLMEDYVSENHDKLDDTYEGTAAVSGDDVAAALASVSTDQAEPPAHYATDDAIIPDNSQSAGLDTEPSDYSAQYDDDPAADLTQANVQVLDEHNNELDDMLIEKQQLVEKNVEEPVTDESLIWDEEDDVLQSRDSISEEFDLPHHAEADENIQDPVVYGDDPYTDELKRQADELGLNPPEDEVAAMRDELRDQARVFEDPASLDENPIATSLAHDDTVLIDSFDSEPSLQDDLILDQDEPINIAGEGSTDSAAALGSAPVAGAVAAVGTAVAAGVSSAPDLSEPFIPSQRTTAEHSGHSTTNSELELPLDLTEGRRGKDYSIYRRDVKAQAVKDGVSWSALFFTLPYLLYRQLFGTALAYAVLWIVSLGGLLISALAWIDAGANVTPLTQACTIGFGLIAFIGLIYLPFRYGNKWRADKLENRGYELVAVAKAANPGKAIARARRHAALLN